MLVEELEKVLKVESDREVIILSDRRNHLQEIESCLRSKGLNKIGYYVGGMKQSDLKESEEQNILLGTYNMVSEGFDLPKLNTLVLASPKSDVEQSVGRIQRQLKEDRKYTPLIIDIVDQFSLFNNQGIKRKTFYKKKGYTIDEVDKLDNKVQLKEMAFLE
jgi:superfamily II DNA or RNA helicase